MTSSEIKWAPIIPLVGGFPIGAELAIGSPPEYVGSYSGFWGNDQHYMNYLNNIRGLNVPYVNFTENLDYKNPVDIVVATPPCAALSALNTGASAEVKGSGCAKNEWMYQAAQDAIIRSDPKVILIENAPALSTNKGKGVADKLYEIAKSNGRSLLLYKTSTSYHGIPQNRDRTFAVIVKSKDCPKFDWYERERVSFAEHLKSANGSLSEMIVNPNISTEPYGMFIEYKTGLDRREVMIRDKFTTAFNWVNDHKLLHEAVEWFKTNNMEKAIRAGEHAIMKFSQGKGIWDGSTHVFGEAMNAVIGRNMHDTMHPTESRSLSYREIMHMMGLPDDFELVDPKKNLNHLAQSVPTCTARDVVLESMKFIRGELEFFSGYDYVKQDNHNEKITNHLTGVLIKETPNLFELAA
jgi:site-specific DNA-cytosine methylase